MKRCTQCQRTLADVARFCPYDGTPVGGAAVAGPPPGSGPGALVGTVVGGVYVVEERLGETGLATVYRARDVRFENRIALEVVDAYLLGGATQAALLRPEVAAALGFRHPNAPAAFDLLTLPDGSVCLAREPVEGRSLRDELARRGPLSPEEVVDLLAPVASALDAAHAEGLVHRDVKPDNIVLASAGGRPRVVVIGFLTGALASAAEPDAVLGTPAYMSPEQWGVRPRDGGPAVDRRADVYALGVVTHELTAGRPPFDARSPASAQHAHMFEPPTPLDLVRPDLPPGFAAAVARALAKDRTERQPSAGALVEELRRALEDRTEAGYPTGNLPMYPGGAMPGSTGSVGSMAPLAGDMSPTPGLELVCPNDETHPRVRLRFFNRLVAPRCKYCNAPLVDSRGR